MSLRKLIFLKKVLIKSPASTFSNAILKKAYFKKTSNFHEFWSLNLNMNKKVYNNENQLVYRKVTYENNPKFSTRK